MNTEATKNSYHRITFQVSGIQADVVISAMELPEFVVKVVNAAGKVGQIDQVR